MAVNIAGDSRNPHRHGAVLVKSGRVISFAPNIERNHAELFSREASSGTPENKELVRKYCSEHAEARAIRLAGNNARGSVVYIARVNKANRTMLSKPCNDCANLMESVGVKAVVYTS